MLTPTITPAEKVLEAVLAYYRQADKVVPAAQDVVAWLRQLAPADQVELASLPLADALHLPAFRRYLLERRGFSMQAYMMACLTPHELPYWIDDGDGGLRLPPAPPFRRH